MQRFAKILIIVFVVSCPRLSDAADLTLAWDAASDGVTTGYIISYGTVSRSYSQQVNVGNKMSHTLSGLIVGTTYYFAVRAYDPTGLISTPSNEVSATIAVVIPPITP